MHPIIMQDILCNIRYSLTINGSIQTCVCALTAKSSDIYNVNAKTQKKDTYSIIVR